MGTTTEELKKLYAKLGGAEETAKDTSTPGEVLNAINELDIGGGSGNLPPVTPEDNGKVLGVVNGNWAKTEVEAQIADESVTTAKLHDEAITTDKMSDYAVTTDKVANEAITAEKIKIASRTRSKNAGEDGLSLSVTTENGQITAVSGGIAPNTYDNYGAANTAKSEVIGTSEDDPDADTINGAKAYTDEAIANVAQSDWNQADNTQQDYIKNKPQLGTAASKNIPTSGNAGLTQVVMGNDTRLSDARSANDVYDWAKASAKPTYTPQEVGAIPSTEKGSASGVAELDENGKVLSSQLPSYVDDVLEGYLYNGKFYEDQEHTTEIPGEASKIYVELETNKTYRWTGNGYAEISESLALGETSSTAYRGDRGKAAYEHSQTTSGNPHHVTKEDVGLGNVGNFKAVSTEANQGLTTTEKANARSNIGAGTSSFDGNYNSLDNKPTLGTAAAKDIPASGNASTSEVVMGNDTRLTDSRNAKDVSEWAKAPTKPTYTASEVGLGNVGNFKAVSTEANQGLTATEKANAKANLDLGTAAEKDIPVSGNASSGQVVMGNDTRLTDSRPSSDVVQTYDSTSEVPISGKGVSEALGTVVPSKTASGNPIDIYDGANSALPKCVSAITGSQDLHGYDKPWVGGAGKNKCISVLSDIKTKNTSGTWSGNSYTQSEITFTVNIDNGNNVIGFNVSGTATDQIDFYIVGASNSYESMGLEDARYRMNGGDALANIYIKKKGGGSAKSDSDEDVTFSSLATDTYRVFIRVNNGVEIATPVTVYPMIRLETESSTFAPYSNICPITAYTEGKIEVRGKNLIKQIVRGYINPGGTNAIKIDNNSETVLIKVVEGVTYTLSSSAHDRNVIGYAGVDTLVNGTPISNIHTPTSYTWTAEWSGWTAWYINSSASADVEATAQVEKGSTPTAYEPYTSTTHTTTYPSAIYRGSEDVVNGEVTETHKLVDMGTLNWVYDSTNDFFYTLISERKAGANFISSQYNNVGVKTDAEMASVANGSIASNPGGKYINVKDTRFIDATAFTTAMDGVQLAYELATPTTSTVTPTNLPVKSLNGYSHIESSTGEMVVEYITKNFQPLLDLMKKMVIANPSESATVALSSLKVDDTVYSLPSGGGVTAIASERNSYTLEVS